MSILIADTVDFVSVGKSMRDTQIMQTIDLLLEDFSVYKIDFFIACFNNAKKGYYGKQYDRIDGQIIFEWLTEYEYEYQSEIERNRVTEKTLVEQGKISLLADQSNQKLIADRDNTPVPMPDYVKAAYMQIIVRPVPVSIQPARTEAQLIVDGFTDDFNRIYADHGSIGGIRTIPIYGAPGKSFNIQEYIECRMIAYENKVELNDYLEECIKELNKFHKARYERAQAKKLKYFKKN